MAAVLAVALVQCGDSVQAATHNEGPTDASVTEASGEGANGGFETSVAARGSGSDGTATGRTTPTQGDGLNPNDGSTADTTAHDAACAWPPPPSGYPACGSSLCGNGVRDTCGMGCNQPQPNCPSTLRTEACDGVDLGGATCVSRGYSGGSLGCTADCQFDERGCTVCAPVTGALLSCQSICSFPVFEGAFAIAATDSTLGLAWYSEDNSSTDGGSAFLVAHFALFDRDFHVTAEATPWPLPTMTIGTTPTLAVAPSLSGWLVLVNDVLGTGSGFTLYALDAQARPLGSPNFVQTGTGASFGVSPGRSPLLVWGAASDDGGVVLRSATLADDASFQGIPVDVLNDANQDRTSSILADNNGYLVATSTKSPEAVVTLRLGSDGRPSGPAHEPVGPASGLGALAALGNGVGLLFQSGGTQWALLDWSGNLLAGPMSASPQPIDSQQLMSAGADDVLVTRAYDPSSPGALFLQSVHVDAQGAQVGTPSTIARLPQWAYQATVQGDRIVVAFSGPAALQIATVSLH